MLDIVAHSIGNRVGALYAAESRFKSSGDVVPLHFHAAIVALKPNAHQTVAGVWAGGSLRASSIRELAVVEPYNPARAGVEYIIKQAADIRSLNYGRW
jgi:hypothetical protein